QQARGELRLNRPLIRGDRSGGFAFSSIDSSEGVTCPGASASTSGRGSWPLAAARTRTATGTRRLAQPTITVWPDPWPHGYRGRTPANEGRGRSRPGWGTVARSAAAALGDAGRPPRTTTDDNAGVAAR